MDKSIILSALCDWKNFIEVLSSQGFDSNIVEDRCLKAIKEINKHKEGSNA